MCILRTLRIPRSKISMGLNWYGNWRLSWILKRVENLVSHFFEDSFGYCSCISILFYICVNA